MKSARISLSVEATTQQLINSLKEKGFTIFADIDHQQNAKKVELELPASRVIIFGNPLAGTKLLQKDLNMSLDLPMRIAIIDDNSETKVIYQTSEDYCKSYEVEDHPVLEKIDSLFDKLISEIA